MTSRKFKDPRIQEVNRPIEFYEPAKGGRTLTVITSGVNVGRSLVAEIEATRARWSKAYQECIRYENEYLYLLDELNK